MILLPNVLMVALSVASSCDRDCPEFDYQTGSSSSIQRNCSAACSIGGVGCTGPFPNSQICCSGVSCPSSSYCLELETEVEEFSTAPPPNISFNSGSTSGTQTVPSCSGLLCASGSCSASGSVTSVFLSATSMGGRLSASSAAELTSSNCDAPCCSPPGFASSAFNESSLTVFFDLDDVADIELELDHVSSSYSVDTFSANIQHVGIGGFFMGLDNSFGCVCDTLQPGSYVLNAFIRARSLTGDDCPTVDIEEALMMDVTASIRPSSDLCGENLSCTGVECDGWDEGPSLDHATMCSSADPGCAGAPVVPSGFIDPRIESSNGSTVNLGMDTFTLVFTEEVFDIGSTDCGLASGNISTSSFQVTETGAGTPPSVTSVAKDGSDPKKIVVTLDRDITIQEWTTIIACVEDSCGNVIADQGNLGASNEPDRIDVAFLPGDVNQDGTVSPFDFLDRNKFCADTDDPACGDPDDLRLYIDSDRNCTLDCVGPTGADYWASLDIVNGTGNATQSWSSENLNNSRP